MLVYENTLPPPPLEEPPLPLGLLTSNSVVTLPLLPAWSSKLQVRVVFPLLAVLGLDINEVWLGFTPEFPGVAGSAGVHVQVTVSPLWAGLGEQLKAAVGPLLSNLIFVILVLLTLPVVSLTYIVIL